MRIVEVINALQYRSGAEVFLSNLSCELNKKNEVIVISLFDGINDSFIELFNRNNIQFYTCHKRKGFDFKAAKTFKKIVNQINPDIIHFHLSCLPTYFLAFGTKKRKWIIIETIHSIPGKMLSKSAELIRKLFIKKGLLSFVGISENIALIMKERYKKCSCITINNGCYFPEYKGFIQNKKEYDFIIVASFSEVKDHLLLFKVFKELCDDNHNYKLLCVGGGPLLESSKEFVKDYNLERNVIFTGSQSNVFKYLSMAKIFVLSSKYEGNPISVLEAMSMGLPLVVPNVGGIPNIVKNNRNGLLYEPSNYEQLLYSMKELLNDEALQKTITNNNLTDIENYTITKCSQEYEEFFIKIKG